MYTVMIISVVIVIIVLILSVVTTSKAYKFKHTIDPPENSAHHDNEKNKRS